jgi:hypothetical protein
MGIFDGIVKEEHIKLFRIRTTFALTDVLHEYVLLFEFNVLLHNHCLEESLTR